MSVSSERAVDVEGLMAAVHARMLERENVLGPAIAAKAPSAEDGRFYELRRNEAYNHHQYGAFGRELSVKRQGAAGRAELFAKRVVRKLLGWYVRPQIEFNASLTRAVAETCKHLEALAAETAALRAENAELKRAIAAMQESDAAGIDYAAFEQRFRGSREAIRQAQAQYVACFESQPRVLDFGCGRGEFLELLREAGLEAYGVDLDAGMVAESHARGLAVEQADGIEHLAGLPDGTLGGLYASQVIEHMTPGTLAKLLRLASAKVGGGGVVIAETPNPICEAAMRNFYLDPTHIRPVHPELLRFLAESAGLALSHYVFTSAMPGYSPAVRHVYAHEQLGAIDVSQYRDYAVVLRKP